MRVLLVPGFICGLPQPSPSTEVKAEAEAFVRKLRRKVYRKNQVWRSNVPFTRWQGGRIIPNMSGNRILGSSLPRD